MSRPARVRHVRIRHDGRPPEQLISAIVLNPGERRPPPPAPPPALPTAAPARDPDTLLIGIARLDRSGRVHERTLFAALGWSPGHELGLDTAAGGIVVASVPGGRHRIDDRGALALPAAARRMCGIEPGPPVVLAAAVDQQLLLVHPAASVARLLADHHRSVIGAPVIGTPVIGSGNVR